MRYDGFTHELQCGGEVVRFAAKPPAEVLFALKANGYRWNPREKAWWRRRAGQYADLLAWIDRKLNPDRPAGRCWQCGEPGRFRPRGAACPVLCDECAREEVRDAVA